MESPPRLIRALGVLDLTWLYLVAVVNLNLVPVVASEGLRIMWLWGAAILFFFVPQGIGVIELARRMPGEGGLYLWTKEAYGDFHGFICGWCYWMTNMFFVPTLLVYVTGVAVYIGGAPVARLGDNPAFYFALTVTLLWLTILANIHGLGVGKWVNNIGGIGALAIAVALFFLAGAVFMHHGGPMNWTDTPAGATSLPLSTVGVVCLGLVGMELGPVMGDEIRDPRTTIRRAVVLGGGISAIVYVGTTLALLIGVPQSQMAVVQGMMQALDKMSASLGLGWILLPLAILMIASIVGSTSAWTSGSARILFVCGLDRYLPKSLGKVHPKYGSPHVALTMFGLLASSIIAMSFVGASVKEAYLTLLDLSVALQMISYLYLFLSLMRVAFFADTTRICFSVPVLRVASVSGVLMTAFGLVMSFVPSRQISSIWSFELKMVLTLSFFIGLAAALFSYYSRTRPEADPAPAYSDAPA